MQREQAAPIPATGSNESYASSYLRRGQDLSDERTATGASSALIIDVESWLLKQQLLQECRREVELKKEVNRKLQRLSANLDSEIQNQTRLAADRLPAHVAALTYLGCAAGLSKTRIGQLVGVTRQTIHNWDTGGPIAATKRAHLLAVRDVIERAALQHRTPEELAAWLDTPRGAEGQTPAQLLAARAFDRARLLAMATPSPSMRRPAAEWANRPVPPAFARGAERYPAAEPPEPDDLTPAADDEQDEHRAVMHVEEA